MAKIVVLTSRFPFPLDKGDKLRIYNQLQGLSLKNEIHLIALDEKKISNSQLDALTPFCKSINVFRLSRTLQIFNLFRTLFSRMPLQVGLFYSNGIHKQINQLLKKIKPDAIYCHLIRMSEYVRKEKSVSKTLDYMDAFSIGMKKRAEVSHPLMRQLFNMEYRRLISYEKLIFDEMENKIIISVQDRDAIDHPLKEQIQIVQNGVDFNIFFPVQTEKKYDLLFTGNMGYPPNIEAADYAASKILPEIQKLRPGTTLLIAGIDAPLRIKRLSSQSVFVIEEFSHIREAFAQSRIMLAPMLISIGLQNKILQAMAMDVPCIVSSQANNAIGAADGKEIIEANTPEKFASACHDLLTNAVKYDSVRLDAKQFVRKNFDWKMQNEKLENIILS